MNFITNEANSYASHKDRHKGSLQKTEVSVYVYSKFEWIHFVSEGKVAFLDITWSMVTNAIGETDFK